MQEDIWKPLSPGHIGELFGSTTATQEPAAFRCGDLCVVLRGEQEDGQDEETLWWSLCRIHDGEVLELARDYGVEEVDGDLIEVSWDGLFPRDWVEAFATGHTDWIRLSVSEVFELFGDTVEFEQPQGWKHRDGAHCLVLTGALDEETQEEEYAWVLVRLEESGVIEVAWCDPGNLFGEEEFLRLGLEGAKALPPSPPAETDEPSLPEVAPVPEVAVELAESEEDASDTSELLWDGWWEEAPFDWADRLLAAQKARLG